MYKRKMLLTDAVLYNYMTSDIIVSRKFHEAKQTALQAAFKL